MAGCEDVIFVKPSEEEVEEVPPGAIDITPVVDDFMWFTVDEEIDDFYGPFYDEEAALERVYLDPDEMKLYAVFSYVDEFKNERRYIAVYEILWRRSNDPIDQIMGKLGEWLAQHPPISPIIIPA